MPPRLHHPSISPSLRPMPSSPPALPPSLSLAGRTALVTGGSRGIGAATVRLLREAGARVAFSFNTATDRAEALAAELGGPDLCRALQQTLATPADGRALITATLAAFDALDILIINHGVWPAHDQPIATMPDAQWSSTLAINLQSVFGLVQAATAHLLAQPQAGDTPRGHIILVASTAAQRGEAFHADYAASKGALVSLTKSLSSELAPQGILVNCVAPGWVATEMSAAALADPAASKRAMSLIPLGRPAHVLEVAGPILFLCTPFAGFMSGEIVNVNGGAVLTG